MNYIREIDMTSGSLWKKILFFSLPLMLSNLLQALFNMADVAVVGRYAGNIPLGSVGSTSQIVFLLTGILIGIGGGVNAVTAKFAGGHEDERVHRSVSSSFVLCLISGIALLLFGVFLSRPILELIDTKPELIDGAVLYLKIYSLGCPALAIYNFGNAVLSAIGDTKRPLFYLITAGVTNVILNMFFVIVLNMDVDGVALASVISQYLSAFLILTYLIRCGKAKEKFGLDFRDFRPDRRISGRILLLGIPAGIQNSLFAFANLFIQSAINTFEHTVVEGNSAASNADGLVWDMMAAFYVACTSFIAQNYGARNKKRILKTYWITTVYSVATAVFFGSLLVIFNRQFLSLFTKDDAIIGYGSIRLVIMAASYFISGFMDNSIAAARGIGKSIVPTVIVILGTIVFRIIWVLTVFAHYRTLPSLFLVYASAWLFTAIFGNIYFFSEYRKIKC